MGVVDYKGKLDAMQSVLNSGNTTTADFDLSSNLTTRIQLVTQRNPELIGNQASLFPAITIRIDANDIEVLEMSKNAANARRQANIDFQIVGMLWSDKFISNENDQADTQINFLMENIDEVLRRNNNLNGNLLWSFPERVDFYDALGEESHFRVGVLTYKGVSFY